MNVPNPTPDECVDEDRLYGPECSPVYSYDPSMEACNCDLCKMEKEQSDALVHTV